MRDKAMRLFVLWAAAMGLLRTNVLGAEPLPPRALARIGSHRLYHGPGINCAVLSPDGKRVASAANCFESDPIADKERDDYNRAIVLWDAASGERLREMRVPKGKVHRLAYSFDGKRLAASYTISDEESGVVLFEVETGKLLRRLGDFQAEIGHLEFSPDGKQLRVSEWGGPVSAWDAATGKQLRLWKPPLPTTLDKGTTTVGAIEGVLSPDGSMIVWEMCCSSRAGCPGAWMDGLRVHDALTNKLLYQKKFLDPDQESDHDEFKWSFAFTSDSKRLVADCDKLAVWEAATGRELATVKVPGMVCFTLAPDGRRAAIEEAVTRGEKYRVRLWDIEAGKPLWELCPGFEDLTYRFRRISPVFSANGKTLLLTTDSTLRLFDAATGEERAAPGHRAPVTPRFSTDGRTLFTACAERRCRWNVSGKELTLLNHESRKAWEVERLAQSADGQLFLDRPSDDCVRVRETATGRVLHTLPEYVRCAAFSPDAARLLLYYENSEGYCHFQLYDIRTGKKPGEIKRVMQSGKPILSPNGRLLAWVDPMGAVHLHDAVTGKSVRTLRSSRPLSKVDSLYSRFGLLFSPDGEQLVATGYLEAGSREPIRLPICVLQISNGREIARFYAGPEKTSRTAELPCMACSPDGRLLAIAEKYAGAVRLLEIAGGKVRAEFVGHRRGVRSLVFAPDGKTLASGGEDNVVYLWDATGAKSPDAKPQREMDLSSLWNDLANEDGQRAGSAIASLLRKPEASVAFLVKKLHPVEPLDETRLARLIADLDADAFDTRDIASRELVDLGERAESALRRELANRPTLEARRRMEDILSLLPTAPPKTLRMLRAVEVLEHIGAPAARHCLEALTKGADAPPTRQAKAALQRLANRR
jgi:WD40 repeat protein